MKLEALEKVIQKLGGSVDFRKLDGDDFYTTFKIKENKVSITKNNELTVNINDVTYIKQKTNDLKNLLKTL